MYKIWLSEQKSNYRQIVENVIFDGEYVKLTTIQIHAANDVFTMSITGPSSKHGYLLNQMSIKSAKFDIFLYYC